MSTDMTAHATVDTEAAIAASYAMALGDDACIYSHRLGEWLSHAPQLEEDMAFANVALDLLGQARALYTRVGELDGTDRDEDAIAYFRDERDFRCVHLVQQPRGDFAHEMVRMLWFSAYQCELYEALSHSTDPGIAGVARKAIKEARYHRDHAHSWVVRLGDGTEESHRRLLAAVEWVQPYVRELLSDDTISEQAADLGVGVRVADFAPAVRAYVAETLAEATLTEEIPEPRWHAQGGRHGVHSEPFGYALAEMQYVARSHPGARW